MANYLSCNTFRRNAGTILIFNIPAYTIIFVFTLLPILFSFHISLKSYKLTNPSHGFVGLGNYIYILRSDLFWQSLENTFVFCFFSLLILVCLSLGLALVLNQSIKGLSKLSALVVVPWAIPSLVVGISWAWIFDSKFGIANYLLSLIGIDPLPWLSSPSLAMVSVIVARSWHEITFGTLILLAGLKSIPRTIYQAAEIDGANKLTRFFYITLPLLRNQIAILIVFETIWGLREFATIYAMTYGGPGNATTVLGWLVYKTAFLNYDFGKASAVAFILGLITTSLALISAKLVSKRIRY